MNRSLKTSLLSAFHIAASCSGHHHDHAPILTERLAVIEVEVYDPLTSYVWEVVGVRVVQADQEWSSCICVNPVVDDWYYTDSFGTVVFGAVDLALADVGFQETAGEAVISPDPLEDEVTVLLEISAPGMGSVFQAVDLSWDAPTIFVAVPF